MKGNPAKHTKDLSIAILNGLYQINFDRINMVSFNTSSKNANPYAYNEFSLAHISSIF
jgi:hypothetical protein